MTLHYEDKDGNVQEIEFKYRLATPQAREQYRGCIADNIKADKKLTKAAEVLNKRLADAGEAGNDAEVESIAAEIVQHNSEADNRSDVSFFQLVRLCCEHSLRPQLTDELLSSADIEEVREIVKTFRTKLKI